MQTNEILMNYEESTEFRRPSPYLIWLRFLARHQPRTNFKRESDHKGHLILNIINPQVFLGAEDMYFKDWDAANGANYSIYSLMLLGKTSIPSIGSFVN